MSRRRSAAVAVLAVVAGVTIGVAAPAAASRPVAATAGTPAAGATTPAATTPTTATATTTPGAYVAVGPTRLMDTRSDKGAAGPVGSRQTRTLTVTGNGVPTGVSAVVLNVTVVAPTQGGYLTVWKHGLPRPTASNLNFATGQTVPNLVVAPVSAGGQVDFYTGTLGTVQLLADISGYFVGGTPTAAGAFGSVGPTRLMDTRSDVGAAGPVGSRQTRTLTVTGNGVPTGVSAVVLNVTAVSPTQGGYVTVWKHGAIRPTASNLNFDAGQTVPNLVVAPVSTDGQVDFYAGTAGHLDLLADVAGYFLGGTPTAAGAFGALGPLRLMDTRYNVGAIGPVVSRQTADLDVVGQGVPAGVTAVVLNVTAVSPTQGGYLTVWARGASRPIVSNLNFAAGQTVPNLVVAPVSTDGYVSFYAGTPGTVQLLADVAGYVLPSAPTAPVPPAMTPGNDVYDRTAGLYTGSGATQLGVAAGTITAQAATVLSGKVTTTSGSPYVGATVTVVGHPEFGHTTSGSDGSYHLVVNGGSPLLVQIADPAHAVMTVQRRTDASTGQFLTVDTVTLMPQSTVAKPVALGASTPALADLGTVTQSDCQNSSGATTSCSRTNMLYVPSGTHATEVLPNGSTQALSGTQQVRATEYTQGSTGPQAMPGTLPAQSAYTYAVDLSVDGTQGAQTVRFTDASGQPQTLYNYLTNFLQFPVGTHVPAAYYDSATGQWNASHDGDVIKILTVSAGTVTVDSNGDGTADNGPDGAPLTTAERSVLAATFHAGDQIWRVPITHFTPWDYNFPYGCKTVCKPPTLKKYHDPRYPDPCEENGSVIGCENQSLGERVAIADTPYTLDYDSSLTPGYVHGRTIHVPAAGTVPSEADAYTISATVAGRTYSTSSGDLDAVWNGTDMFGNRVYGPVTATITVTAYYQLVYYGNPVDFDQSWAQWPDGGSPIGVERTWSRAAFTGAQTVTLDGGRPATDSIGGWNLDDVSHYDPASGTETAGDGSVRHVQPASSRISDLGNPTSNGCTYHGSTYYCGDGGPVSQATLTAQDLTAGPDGNLYFYDEDEMKIRRITDPLDPDPARRIVTAIAGTGADPCYDQHTSNPNPCLKANGTAALGQQIDDVDSLSVAPDGTVYGTSHFGVNDQEYVFALTPGASGAYSFAIVAGTGQPCPDEDTTRLCGDGGPAAAAETDADLVAAAPDGVYFSDADTSRVRFVGRDGSIRTAVGCLPAVCDAQDQNAPVDGMAADDLDVGNAVFGMSTAPDGSLWISDGFLSDDGPSIYQIDTAGRVHPYGSAIACSTLAACKDGGPARTAGYAAAEQLVVDAGGTVHVFDDFVDSGGIVERAFQPNGTVQAEVGSDQPLTDQDSPDGQGALSTPLDVGYYNRAVLPDGQVVFTDSRAGLALLTVQPGAVRSGTDYLVPSADGTQYRDYDASGNEVALHDSLTKSVQESFGYDSGGRLVSITDSHGRVTHIVRGADGTATAVRAPSGATTTLGVDANGYLDTITQPTGESITAQYDANGLMQSLTDFAGARHTFAYDARGRLTKDTAPDGSAQTLACAAPCDDSGDTTTVTRTSGTGQVTTYTVTSADDGSTTRSETEPSGARTTVVQAADGSTITTTSPDGTRETIVYGADPRFGRAAQEPISDTLTRPSGIRDVTTIVRQVTFANASDPFSARQITTTVDRNGAKSATAWTWNGTAGTQRTTSADGRVSVVDFDSAGLPVDATEPGGSTVTYGYDTAGDLDSYRVGTAPSTTYAYDAGGHLITSTSATGTTITYGYDADGRPTTTTDATGHTWQVGYDANSDVSSVVTPRGSFGYSYDTDDRLTGFTMPGAAAATTKGYDADGNYTGLTLPGQAPTTRTVSHDLLTGTTGGGASTTYTPKAGTDLYSSTTYQATGQTAQNLTLGYDGATPVSQTFAGVANGTLSATVDADGRTSAVSVKVGSSTVSVARTFDADGLLTGEGPFTLTRGGPDGATSAITDGAAAYAQTVDGAGRVTARSLTVHGTPVFSESLTLDADGQVTSQKLGSATTAYSYDSDGRLAGAGAVTYGYDADGNLLTPSAGAASYDTADRITRAGATTYTVDDAGRLTARGTDTFGYDAAGDLTRAAVGAQTATYTYDGADRLVAETVGGRTTQYLYGDPADQLQVSAVVEPGGSVDTLYYDDIGLLIGFDRAGTRYYVGSDHLGSPRVVTDAAGTVVQAVSYDAWGRATPTTAFAVPLGFAGGIPDPVTGFVHLGIRDYDPATGRFVTRDPTLFSGGLNLFGYALDDPQSVVDRTGLIGVGFTAYDGVGGGVSVSLGRDSSGNVGVTICGEAGFGVGGGLEVTSAGYSKSSVSVTASVTGKIGLAKGSISASITAGPCVPYSQKVGAKVGFGPTSAGIDSSGKITVTTDPSKYGGDPPSPGAKVEAKVAAKGCYGTTF